MVRPGGANPNDKTVVINPLGHTTTGGLMKTLHRYQGGEAIYSEVQCTMGNGHMGLNPCEQADMTENITFPQLLWRVVNLNIEGKSY